MQLKPEVKSEWLEALRSGEYEQTTGRLHRNGGWCCLGVLCDRAVRAGVVSQVATDEGGGGVGYLGPDDTTPRTATLPTAVVEWAFVNEEAVGPYGEDPHNPIMPSGESLAELNDGFGLSFEEIAHLIEAGL